MNGKNKNNNITIQNKDTSVSEIKDEDLEQVTGGKLPSDDPWNPLHYEIKHSDRATIVVYHE